MDLNITRAANRSLSRRPSSPLPRLPGYNSPVSVSNSVQVAAPNNQNMSAPSEDLAPISVSGILPSQVAPPSGPVILQMAPLPELQISPSQPSQLVLNRSLAAAVDSLAGSPGESLQEDAGLQQCPTEKDYSLSG